jgi:hypothetical protein
MSLFSNANQNHNVWTNLIENPKCKISRLLFTPAEDCDVVTIRTFAECNNMSSVYRGEKNFDWMGVWDLNLEGLLLKLRNFIRRHLRFHYISPDDQNVNALIKVAIQ